MIDVKRKDEAKASFDSYLRDGLIKKEDNILAQKMHLENARISLDLAEEIAQSPLKPHMWVIVVSYYSMFYIANAVLLELGYKVQDKIVHQVTSDALIVLVLHRLEERLLEGYESAQSEALEIASVKADEIIGNYDHERGKRRDFQYKMLEGLKESKAQTSLKRAREFNFEMRKLLDSL